MLLQILLGSFMVINSVNIYTECGDIDLQFYSLASSKALLWLIDCKSKRKKRFVCVYGVALDNWKMTFQLCSCILLST